MNYEEGHRFQEGDDVLDKARRYGLGRVVGAPSRIGGEWHYTVRFEGGQTKRLPERHLDSKEAADESLLQIVLNGRFGSREAFQRAISVARIRKESENRTTVYSFDAQRVQFQAYQYRPLLRFLDSEDRRLLIADEVGLGKTIEAGLILAELEARRTPDRVLVICPSRLREKWHEEMNRKFAQDFEIWGSAEIQKYAARVRQNPHRSRLRAIVSLQGIRNESARDTLLDAAEHFDLLIVDESHHVRNRSTESHRTLEAFTAHADAVLFLSATPIHLRSEDLFNQLRLLRPTEFRQPEVFALALRQNEGVVKALERIRSRKSDHLPLAAREVELAFAHSLFATEGLALVREYVARLRGAPPAGLREWFELERDVERLHYLANIVTRTRKREVQAFRAIRKSYVVSVTWTPEEQEAYRRITGLAGAGSWPRRQCPFGTIQRQRMAASSIIGTLFYRDDRRGLEDMRADLFDDLPDNDGADDTLDPEPLTRPPRDSKLERLLEILHGIERETPGAKVLIFTYFVGTSRYLADALNTRGIRTLRIAGDVPSSPNHPESDERGARVREFYDDPGIRVMVSTEVGSEGLDFQFCSKVVNYDLPWNPMTVEQRIGRIDRFGQKAEKLHIWSLVVDGTVEERILVRLYQRIGIFERSIGPLEEILGEVVAGLSREYFEGRLTPEQAETRAAQSYAAVERERQNTEQLEAEAERLFGHEDFIRAECERVRHLGRYVTPAALLAVLTGYLSRCHSEVRLADEGRGVWSLKYSERLNQALLSDPVASSSGTARMRRYTRDGRFWFALEGAVAYDRQDVDLLNASHPLVLVALKTLEELLADPLNRTGVARVAIQDPAEAVESGTYVVASFRVNVKAIRKRTAIETCAIALDDGRILEPDTAERLLHLVLTAGEEAPQLREERAVTLDHWNALDADIVARKNAIETREANENALLVARRRARVQAEHEQREREIDSRERTARENGTFGRMERMLAGQRDKSRERLQAGLREVEEGAYVQVDLDADPIAVCLVEVVRRER